MSAIYRMSCSGKVPLSHAHQQAQLGGFVSDTTQVEVFGWMLLGLFAVFAALQGTRPDAPAEAANPTTTA
jgi:hypothetical protein